MLVRNPWDENWHATLDGKPVPLLHADYVMQGVAVPAGTHTLDLTYRDPAIGVGLWISGTAWMLLLVAFLVLRRRTKPVRIEGVHVVLRPLAPPELDAWEESWSSMPQGASPIPPSRDRLRERMARSGTWWGRSLDLAIEAEGRLIGQIGIYEPPSGALPEGVHQFGVMIFSPADRGRGFGTEAVRLLCDWLFRQKSAARVEAGTLRTNGPRRGVLARLGFVAAGTEVAHGVEYLLFALDRAAWDARSGVEWGS